MGALKRLYLLLQVTTCDFLGKNRPSNNIDSALYNAVNWLCIAQDHSPDDGVSEGYHLIHGWLPSYPETTGYIIETLCNYAEESNNNTFMDRALRMADWLVGIQHKNGSIPDSHFKNQMVFDTGQVLFGFVRAYEETRSDRYIKAALNAGNWLISVQETNGSWQKFAVGEIPHTYYARVAWSLTQLHKITGEEKFIKSCRKNVEWALTQQHENGWFNKASFKLIKHDCPYTHTIAYTIRGILESGIYLKDDFFVYAAQKAMDSLLQVLPLSGGFYGSYDKSWQGNPRFSCLTGNAQLAIIFFKLYQITRQDQYLAAGRKINKYMLSKQELRIKNINIFGSIAGSAPIWGEYIHFMYPNWATKFFIDSLLLEKKLTS